MTYLPSTIVTVSCHSRNVEDNEEQSMKLSRGSPDQCKISPWLCLVHREAFGVMAQSKQNYQEDEREHYASIFHDANLSHAFTFQLFWERNGTCVT